MKDNRWTPRCTVWQPRRGKRSSLQWDDQVQDGKTTLQRREEGWGGGGGGGAPGQESERQKTMEGIGGGLHPAVNGQSLGEK